MPVATDIADPRNFPASVDPTFAREMERAAASLASTAVANAEEIDAGLVERMADALRDGEGQWLSALLAAAPSAAIARYLWRRLLSAWSEMSVRAAEPVGLTLFALPVVLVTGRLSGSGESRIDCALPDNRHLAEILVEHDALAGNRNFGLAHGLVAAETIEVERLPALLAWAQFSAARRAEELQLLEVAPIRIAAGEQAVHLRFLVGAALGASGAAVGADSRIASWGIVLAQELTRQLMQEGVSVLALPRAPRPLPHALQDGRAAQREVAAQLFASNALRNLRASVGEPAAVISAHRCPDACGGGELRLSLSSRLDSRQAEGFRCPLFAYDRVGDVATMLLELLGDCRVTDVQLLSAVYPDRDSSTGLRLLFKAEAVPGAGAAALQ
jgi:hypothetical protein